MQAEEIREIEYMQVQYDDENLFVILREIAAQLAELNERIGGSAPTRPRDQDCGGNSF